MRVNVTNLGGGLTRLEIEPTCGCEPLVIPTHIADDVMRDVVRRERGGVCHTPSMVGTSVRPSWERPLPTPRVPNRVESGIDAHIDRPQRDWFGGNPYLADAAFRKAMGKYNTAVNAIKACDWPCKEDLKGVPAAISQHNPMPRTQMVGVAAPCVPSCRANKEEVLNRAVVALEALVEALA